MDEGFCVCVGPGDLLGSIHSAPECWESDDFIVWAATKPEAEHIRRMLSRELRYRQREYHRIEWDLLMERK